MCAYIPYGHITRTSQFLVWLWDMSGGVHRHTVDNSSLCRGMDLLIGHPILLLLKGSTFDPGPSVLQLANTCHFPLPLTT